VLLPGPGHLSLLVPDGETLNVKLKTFVGRLADTFRYDLSGSDRFLAGVTLLTIGGSAPEARDAVIRKVAMDQLATNDKTEIISFHVALGVNLGEKEPDSPES
jgi:hypothetical protein